MQTIKRITATIYGVKDLTPTARELHLRLQEPMPFIPGSFVNLFIKNGDLIERRAFSISSSSKQSDSITLSVRLNESGKITPLFWRDDIVNKEVSIMGPLGLNTADKMLRHKIFLFGFGIGNGVVKSLADYFAQKTDVESLIVMTGNRHDLDIVHLDYFDSLSSNPKVKVWHIVSKPSPTTSYKTGYIQDHIAGLDFNDSDVYVCGQEVACQGLVSTIKQMHPENCQFFVEGFH